MFEMKLCLARATLTLGSIVTAALLSGCASTMLPVAGPSRDAFEAQRKATIPVVELTPALANQLRQVEHPGLSAFNGLPAPALTIGAGDVVEVAIWEASPPLLFGVATDDGNGATPKTMMIPGQVVPVDGEITVPFAGHVKANGCTPREIEIAIQKALTGKANRPQVVVRVVKTAAQDVAVVGEVTANLRMPLTARGERLLDAIAAAGGVKTPVEKATLQLSRGSETRTVPLETVIRDPRQNVVLRPGDVVTAYYQPLAFTALGAVAKAGEVPFEATGLNLAQALGRVGGLIDNRANATGVFLFRGEPTAPVIYRLDLSQPQAFLAMRDFQVRDKDVLYVANAPLSELKKFMEIVSTIVYPTTQVRY